MKITLTGSLGNISAPLAKQLLDAGHDVTIVSSSEKKKGPITALGASAAIGSVEDVDFLTRAFSSADVVYTMVPPNFNASDYQEYIGGIGRNYAQAIQAAGVKKVVNLSSVGAHLEKGTGPIAGLHEVEETLNAVRGIVVKHVRAGFFFVNFYHNVDMIRQMNFLGSNYDGNKLMVLVHHEDIAQAIAEEIQSPFEKNIVRYVSSDERITGDIAAVLGGSIGKPDLKWVEFSDEQSLNGMTASGMPGEIARNYVEMGSAVRSGVLWEDYLKHKPSRPGKKNLELFAKEFAAAYGS